jgi:ribosome-binding protein aMBF1 (putative translation factor)
MSVNPSQAALDLANANRAVPDEVRTEIRKRRIATGRSYDKLAVEFGYSPSMIAKICNEDAADILKRAKGGK